MSLHEAAIIMVTYVFGLRLVDKDLKYSGDIFDNVPKQPSNNSLEIEWSETPHLQTYSLPLIKEGIVVGYV